MTSNLICNLNKIRAANKSTKPEKAVFIFDYFASDSAVGQSNQRPLVRVIQDSLQRTAGGEWLFRGVNLYRVNESSNEVSQAIRTYRLDRINGIIRQP
jgi:hypothetical protein